MDIWDKLLFGIFLFSVFILEHLWNISYSSLLNVIQIIFFVYLSHTPQITTK